MKKMLMAGLLALAGVVMVQAQTYDRNEVVKVMRGNVTLMNGVKADLAANKLNDAADKFYQFAKAQGVILPYTPPKGTKAEWDRVIGLFIDASLRGAAASLKADKVKAQAALDELMVLNRQGHGTFR